MGAEYGGYETRLVLMLNTAFFKPGNFLIIAGIALIARVAFVKAFNALDGGATTNSDS